METLQIGSAAWTSGQEYYDEYADRIRDFNKHVNQQALLDYASALRENQPCTLSPEFSVGNFNLVRKITFDDGVEWIARLRMPPLPDELQISTSRPSASTLTLWSMQSELATMDLVREMTDIPLPKIFSHNFDPQNPIGCPFSLMQYIHGNTAEEMSRAHPGTHEGIPSPYRQKFWRQLALIMVQLASIRVHKLGSIFRFPCSSGRDGFTVGPFVETGKGPYTSTAEFYSKYPITLADGLKESDGADEAKVPGQEELFEAFRSLAHSFPTQELRFGFGLADYDLNPNNILVDREFNVLAVIDWDSVVAVPDPALYRFPFLMGLDSAAPLSPDSHSAVLRRQERGREFAGVVEEVSREYAIAYASKDRDGKMVVKPFRFTKAGFYSRAAVAFRSMVFVKMKQDFVNWEWVQYLSWLGEPDKVDESHLHS